jgi:hypothetical protein
VNRVGATFVVLCTAVYLLTSAGRIAFPDEEIAFQTTQSLWERGELAIEGIPKRTGEPAGRPDGTFGWASGTDGRRYGFFGHGFSVAALPFYGLGTLAAAHAPSSWRHAIRSDHFVLHERSQQADWTRTGVVLANTLLSALGAWMLVAWLRAVGLRCRASLGCGLALAFGTSAWAYSGTALSEPLSGLTLLTTAWAIARHHAAADRGPSDPRWLWLAGAIAGLSVHVHVLNLIALPCTLGYALWPIARRRAWVTERRAWLGALALGALGLAGLGLSHWARFGDPLETGRLGMYSQFAPPWEALAALLVSPGRSLFVYAPPLLLGLFGWRRMWRLDRAATVFAVAVFASRLVFVACRSDWWGGWSIGARFMVPVVGFGLLGLGAWLGCPHGRRTWLALLLAAAACSRCRLTSPATRCSSGCCTSTARHPRAWAT